MKKRDKQRDNFIASRIINLLRRRVESLQVNLIRSFRSSRPGVRTKDGETKSSKVCKFTKLEKTG